MKPKSIAIKSMTLLVLVPLVINSFAQNQAQWRGKNRDGKYHETGLLKSWPENGPKMLWHFDELGDGHSSAVVTDEVVYMSGTENDNGFIVALNHSGKTLWKKIYGKEWMDSYDGVRATPLLHDGVLYILSGHGKLVAMSSANGNIIWSKNILDEFDGKNIKWGITENLVIHEDKLFCTPGGPEASVVALHKKTGELIWKSKAKGTKSVYCSPTVIKRGNRNLFVTHTKQFIVGIDTDNGKLLWSVEFPNIHSIHPNTPVYNDGMLYCVSGYGKGGIMLELSENGDQVKEVWRNETLDNQMGGVILLDGKIYGSGHNNRGWHCLDWKTGKELFSSGMMGNGNIIYADGKLYCYAESGEVALVSVENGKFEKISSFRVPYGEKQHWAHLVIHNKRLYVRHGSSLMVYSLELN